MRKTEREVHELRMYLRGLAMLGVVALGTTGCCAASTRADAPVAPQVSPSVAHRAEWVQALATGNNCVPDQPSSYKGVCSAAASFGKAQHASPDPQVPLFWGMTFRETFKSAKLRGQHANLAALRVVPTAAGGVHVRLVELWPKSEEDIDTLGSACEGFDQHFFRGEGELPRVPWALQLAQQDDRATFEVDLQPATQGYIGGTPELELRVMPQGWMLAAEEPDPARQEETRLFGVFVPWPDTADIR